MPLTPTELVRYARHLSLPQVGVEGQERLARARVLVVGAGGLGSPASLYLAAAGVGTIGIVDFDRVELTNLQRQLLHDTASVGRAKTDSARQRLAAVNPHVRVVTHEVALDADNALDLISPYDVVVDGTDNFRARYLVNDACVIVGRPNVYASVLRFEGQLSVFATADGPCYRCLYPEPPAAGTVPSCAEAGVLGVLPGIVGTLQATEALKLVLRIGEPTIGRLLLIDALSMRFRTIRFRRDPLCPACGTRKMRTLTAIDDVCEPFVADNGRDEMAPEQADDQAAPDARSAGPTPTVSPRALVERLARGDALTLVDVRERWEFSIAHIEGARLIPLGALDAMAAELPHDRDVILYCHHGSRSLAAAQYLRELGIRGVNLEGGIDAWSCDVDPLVARY